MILKGEMMKGEPKIRVNKANDTLGYHWFSFKEGNNLVVLNPISKKSYELPLGQRGWGEHGEISNVRREEIRRNHEENKFE